MQLTAHPSNLSRSLWMAAVLFSIQAGPPSLLLSTNCMKKHSTAYSRSLTLNTGPWIDSCSTLLAVCLQLNSHPLIIILQANQLVFVSIKLSTKTTVTSQFDCKNMVRDCELILNELYFYVCLEIKNLPRFTHERRRLYLTHYLP